MQWAPHGTTLVLTLCAAAYGAAAGSLLPRAVYRLAVTQEEPWRRHCPAGHELAGPIRGWLGPARCLGCAEGEADPRYGPEVGFFIIAGALACAALALLSSPRPELGVWLLAAPVGLLLTAVDSRVQRLPDVLTLPLAGATVALLGLATLLPGAGGSWIRALLGGAVLAGGYFVLFMVNPRGIGFGDVKLAVALGAALGWYGWDVLFTGTFLSFLLAAAYGSVLLLTRRADRKSAIPFGPFMVLGAFAGLLLDRVAA